MKTVYKMITASFLTVTANAHPTSFDLHSDDFSVLRHIGKEHIASNSQFALVKGDFGLGYTSHGELAYPKVGFIGFEVARADQSIDLVKLQLYKDENGWKVDRVLDNNKIHQANPTHSYTSGHARTDESAKAKIIAAQSLEQKLNRKSLMSDVRATSMRCYVTKDTSRASCRGIYAIKNEQNLTCHAQNYLLENRGGQWSTLQEISDTQKVDYTSGELVSYKPFGMHCG